MIAPNVPVNEVNRLKALESFGILDTLPEQDFDDITRIAAYVCDTPISLLSLLDPHRQWFKSHFGLQVQETPRKDSFCGHAILTPLEPFIVENAKMDHRFHDNPLITGDPYIMFYAGIPLLTSDGLALGTLNVIDTQPRRLSNEQLDILIALSRQVMNLFELRILVHKKIQYF